MNIKSYIFFLLAVFFLLSCNQKKDLKDNPIIKRVISDSGKPYINFEKESHNFGKINKRNKKKETVKVDFEFFNESEIPIIILKADVSCGCLSTKIPEKPILKGEKGTLTVSVDPNQLEDGYFNKNVFVKSNAENDVVLLRISGNVKR